MGISLKYQAIPEQSSLLERLRSDRRINALFSWQMCSCNPFKGFDLEAEEIFDEVASEDYTSTFSSLAEVEQSMDELDAELQRINVSYPNIVRQNTCMNKCEEEIEMLFIQELRQRDLTSQLILLQILLHGRELLAPELVKFGGKDTELCLVPASNVKEGVKVLRTMKSGVLFGGDRPPDPHCKKVFDQWKAFYTKAAKNGEAVLVFKQS